MFKGGQGVETAFDWSKGNEAQARRTCQDPPTPAFQSHVGCRDHDHHLFVLFRESCRKRCSAAETIRSLCPWHHHVLQAYASKRAVVCSAYSRHKRAASQCCLNSVLVCHLRNVMRTNIGEGRVKQPPLTSQFSALWLVLERPHSRTARRLTNLRRSRSPITQDPTTVIRRLDVSLTSRAWISDALLSLCLPTSSALGVGQLYPLHETTFRPDSY